MTLNNLYIATLCALFLVMVIYFFFVKKGNMDNYYIDESQKIFWGDCATLRQSSFMEGDTLISNGVNSCIFIPGTLARNPNVKAIRVELFFPHQRIRDYYSLKMEINPGHSSSTTGRVDFFDYRLHQYNQYNSTYLRAGEVNGKGKRDLNWRYLRYKSTMGKYTGVMGGKDTTTVYSAFNIYIE